MLIMLQNWGMASLAEAGTLQLEFKYLSQLTGNPIYEEKVENVMRIIKRLDKQDGLAPLFLNPTQGRFEMSEIRLGSRADSYYGTCSLRHRFTMLTSLSRVLAQAIPANEQNANPIFGYVRRSNGRNSQTSGSRVEYRRKHLYNRAHAWTRPS